LGFNDIIIFKYVSYQISNPFSRSHCKNHLTVSIQQAHPGFFAYLAWRLFVKPDAVFVIRGKTLNPLVVRFKGDYGTVFKKKFAVGETGNLIIETVFNLGLGDEAPDFALLDIYAVRKGLCASPPSLLGFSTTLIYDIFRAFFGLAATVSPKEGFSPDGI